MNEDLGKHSNWTFRLAVPEDSADFTKWTASNPQIDPDDVRRAMNNPACLYLVACLDGQPIVFAPVYCQLHLSHLVLSPEASSKQKLSALTGLLAFAVDTARQLNISEITTLSRSSYPMGQFAEHVGFEKDSRELFRFDIPPKQS
jgi:hypothetical protein